MREVSEHERSRRELIDGNWRQGQAKAETAAVVDDWVRRVCLVGEELFVGTACRGVQRYALGVNEVRQRFRVQGNPDRMVPADHVAKADPETSVSSLEWTGRYLVAGLAGGRLQVWNDEAWLVLDHAVNTRPCYVCVVDEILVAASGDSLLRWDLRNLDLGPVEMSFFGGNRPLESACYQQIARAFVRIQKDLR